MNVEEMAKDALCKIIDAFIKDNISYDYLTSLYKDYDEDSLMTTQNELETELRKIKQKMLI